MTADTWTTAIVLVLGIASPVMAVATLEADDYSPLKVGVWLGLSWFAVIVATVR